MQAFKGFDFHSSKKRWGLFQEFERRSDKVINFHFERTDLAAGQIRLGGSPRSYCIAAIRARKDNVRIEAVGVGWDRGDLS